MSHPLDHLLSVDFGESTPLSDVFENESKAQVLWKKPMKKVRFADTYNHHSVDVFKKITSANEANESVCKSNAKEVKGILKTPAAPKYYISGKGWSKLSPAVSVTVNISSTEDENYTKSGDVPYKNNTDENSAEGDIFSTTINASSMLDIEDSLKKDETPEFELNVGSLKHEGDEPDSFEGEDNEGYLSKTESDSELELGILEISLTDPNKLEDIKSEMHTPSDKCIEHNSDSSQYFLVNEIRKMSKELFIETASQLEVGKSDDFNGSLKSETLVDKSFISNDIVNDILDTQHGSGKLLLQELENLETVVETSSKTEEKSEDAAKKAECPVVKQDSRIKRPSSPHTMRLKRMLEETVPEKPTARDLRTIAFNAWCTIKADEKKSLLKKLKNIEKQTQTSIMKEKSVKEASAINAFICWKEQKEKTLRLKKESDLKMAETKLSKAQEDKKKKKEEADLVFKAWKKKKDEELKKEMRKQKLKARQESLNKGQSNIEKKLDAATAFNAWKSQKSLELWRKDKDCQMKKELESSIKATERSERDKEAIKAYELWLEYKELQEDRYDWRNQLENKPPWSPPGRIA